MPKKLKTLIIIALCTSSLMSCLTYGRPDSLFVNVVGRDLENFVEYEKTGKIPINSMDYTVIYLKRTSVEMGPPLKPTRGKYLVKHLILRRIADGSEKTIYIEENNASIQEEAIVDKDNHRLFYIIQERDDDFNGKLSLVVYDLENMRVLDKIVILEGRYNSHIYDIFFDETMSNLFLRIMTSYDQKLVSINIDLSDVTEITKEQYEEVKADLNIPKDDYTYTSGGITMKLFSIFPYSDYLPANYKHKYNGLYINDGLNNIRISEEDNYLISSNFWIEDGRYVIRGSSIYDTSGRMKEAEIADGLIIAVY